MTDAYLEAKLLGKPELRWWGRVLESIPPKLRALLFYLAVRGEPVARSEIEGVFWGFKSGHSLRQALHHLRTLPGANLWLWTGQEVAVEIVTDLRTFEAAVRQGHYREALKVWADSGVPEGRSALLAGFELEHAPAFMDWLEVERARTEMLYLETLEHRALELEQVGALTEALSLTQTLLRQDPLNESAYRTAMRLCYRRGHTEEAQSYFEHCRRALLGELGVEPLEETLALAHNPGLVAHAQPEMLTLRQALEQLPDPRSRHGQRYPLTPLMGLVLLAFLNGAHSLRDIVRFGQDHPELLDKLGFHHQTPPGRSALSELFGNLDLPRLRETLDTNAPLPKNGASARELSALGLIETWALEVRHGLQVGETGWLSTALERLGWSGLLSCIWTELADLLGLLMV